MKNLLINCIANLTFNGYEVYNLRNDYYSVFRYWICVCKE